MPAQTCKAVNSLKMILAHSFELWEENKELVKDCF